MRIFNKLGVVFVAMLAAAAPALAQPKLRGTAMLSCSGMPCVDVTLKNGKHLRMLIDLGDARSIMDSTAAKELGVSVAPAAATDGDVGSGFDHAVLQNVRLGDVSLGDVPVLVTDLASHVKKGQIPQADGVLTYTVFRDRLLEMDFKQHRVRVSQPLTATESCSGFCGDISMPAADGQGPPILVTTGFSVNGKPVRAQVDTMYSGTMLIYPDAVARLDLQTENTAVALHFFPFTQGGVSLRESHARVEAFGSKKLGHNIALFFATPQVQPPDGPFDATVGLGLLSGHDVYVDLHSHHIWMKG